MIECILLFHAKAVLAMVHIIINTNRIYELCISFCIINTYTLFSFLSKLKDPGPHSIMIKKANIYSKASSFSANGSEA